MPVLDFQLSTIITSKEAKWFDPQEKAWIAVENFEEREERKEERRRKKALREKELRRARRSKKA